MATLDDLSVLREKPFAEAVTKLEDLLRQSKPVFLIGAGCSKSAGLPLTAELTDKVLNGNELDSASKAILTEVKGLFAGSTNAHIEDYLSELIDLLAIAERRVTRVATQNTITLGKNNYTAEQLRSAANQIKLALAKSIEKPVSIETHRAFVKAIHHPVRDGKEASEPVDYLVLNYDTAIEDALALERVPYSDGIDGGATGWWNTQTFERNGLAARVLKLHGSINWCELPDDPLPRRIGSNVQIEGTDGCKVFIWPASTKYRETQFDPYAQLSDLARQAMRPIRDSQRVLVICGYSFSDSHINIEIDKALRESSGKLHIVAFTNENEPTGQLKIWNEDKIMQTQVLIYANRGYFHSEISESATTDLLWWKFENITRLLGGER